MNEQVKKILKGNIDAIAVFVFMLCIFLYIMFGIRYGSDLWAHANIAKQMLEEHRLFSTNFLMYFLVNLLTLFIGNISTMRVVLVLLIAFANTAKYVIIREVFKGWASNKVAKLSSMSLLVVYVIPLMYFLKPLGIFMSANNMYIGYCVPNVWHNSTVLCMMPFAIACYLLSVKQFREYSDKRNWQIALLLTLSVLVKPSFFFVYVIAYPIIMLSKYGFSKEFYRSLVPLLIGGICLIYEYITIYFQGGNDNSGVIIDVLQLFSLSFWTSHALYLAVSLSLPLLFICLYGRAIIKDQEFWFILIMVICAIGIMWCCKETGPRADHGNFYWQVIAAMWFVYYYILKTTLNNSEPSNATRGGGPRKIMLTAYSIHVIMGCVYLAKFLILNDFA